MTANKDEKQVAAASYILTFYKEVQALTHNYALYNNLILELEAKYGDGFIKKITDEEKENTRVFLQQVRYNSHKCYIQYKSILIGSKINENKDITKLYTKLNTSYEILRADLQLFVIALNSVLITDVITDLLESSQNLVDNVFSNDTK